MTELEQKIMSTSQAYYTDGTSDLTDAEWDALVDQLKKENPDSEVLKKIGWGYDPALDSTPGKKYHHKYGTADGLERCRTWTELKPQFQNKEIDVSLKLDGISVVLYYRQGVLYQALTRGNGEIGIDITDKVNAISSRFRRINRQFTGAVRGEIVMPFEHFKLFQSFHPEAKNPRNSVAGLINGKEITDDLKYLNIAVYSVVGHEVADKDLQFKTIEEVRDWLGFQFMYTVPHVTLRLSESTIINRTFELKDNWSKKWPSDGLVFTSLDLTYNGSEVIQDSMKFKFKSETAQTKVLNIEWNMSKSGYAVPRVQVEPVQLAGTTVQYCTGYNAQYIRDTQLAVGSIVEIEKKGEIIPNINKVIAVSGYCTLPTYCPGCNCELQWEGVHLACKNPNCGSAVAHDTMIWTGILAPVDNLGELLKEKCLTEVYKEVPSIETLMMCKPTAYQTALPGSNAYRMKQMFDKLFSDEPIKLSDAIKALNIPRFGDITADKLAQYPEQVKELLELVCDGSCADGLKLAALLRELEVKIGNANTASLESHMDKIERLKFIQKRIDWCIPTVCAESKGKVAITGKLSVKRADFEKELKAVGYTPAEISKDTKFLITDNPDSSSSKNKKADAWGITKITEQEFRQKYM